MHVLTWQAGGWPGQSEAWLHATQLPLPSHTIPPCGPLLQGVPAAALAVAHTWFMHASTSQVGGWLVQSES